MPTSDASWSARVRVVGDLERPDHWFLTEADDCAFFGEYTAGGGYAHSFTNQLVLNLKKSPDLAGTPQYAWKGRAIRDVGRAIADNISTEALTRACFVPIPPSKQPGTPGYDDRMVQVARAIGPGVDVREVLVTTAERDAMHIQSTRRDPDALRATLGLNTALLQPAPEQVILLDDVLTTGCSFMVCKAMLSEVWPEAKIFGLFVARRALDRTNDFEGFAVDDL